MLPKAGTFTFTVLSDGSLPRAHTAIPTASTLCLSCSIPMPASLQAARTASASSNTYKVPPISTCLSLVRRTFVPPAPSAFGAAASARAASACAAAEERVRRPRAAAPFAPSSVGCPCGTPRRARFAPRSALASSPSPSSTYSAASATACSAEKPLTARPSSGTAKSSDSRFAIASSRSAQSARSNPSCIWKYIKCRASSPSKTMLTLHPIEPKRAVLPDRCRYVSFSTGTPKLTTRSTCSMSTPRAMRSVQTRTR
mmetsp:Transcript_104642/g.265603  ORF Transcript_104642/g.265603 Transcript_104642/m.265603 type:complete len:256 (-) Transcript_104642:1135-1902(-)